MTNLKKEELANKLNGIIKVKHGTFNRNIRLVTEGVIGKDKLAENRLVVIVPLDNGGCLFVGAIDNIVGGLFDNSTTSFHVFFDEEDVMVSECTCHCRYFLKDMWERQQLDEVVAVSVTFRNQAAGLHVDSEWQSLGQPDWWLDTEAKHARFNVYDDDKKLHAVGIVVDLDEIWPPNKAE
jgi:hypothetical protein